MKLIVQVTQKKWIVLEGQEIFGQLDIRREVVLQQRNGENIPVTERVIMPRVEGAIIIAEGAGDALVRTNIIQAVSAVTGLSAHRIQVFEMAN